VKAGETARMKLETAGVEPGTAACFRVYLAGCEMQGEHLFESTVQVQGDAATVDFDFQVDERLRQIERRLLRKNGYFAPRAFFTVQVGPLTARSGLLDLVDDFVVTVKDSGGQPIRDRAFRIFLSSGEVRDGQLDQNGQCRLTDVAAGILQYAIDVRG
jgi:hypothetical protein